MGKSTRGSFIMRTSVISFGILFLVPAILADTFYWGEREGGQEDLHLRLHLHSCRQRQGKRHWILRQEVQWKCQGDDTEQCRLLIHLWIQCQEGQGQGGESNRSCGLYWRNNHAFRVWVWNCDCPAYHAWIWVRNARIGLWMDWNAHWLWMDRHARIRIRYASLWIWFGHARWRVWRRLRPWLPEGLPRDGWSLSNGQHARLPCSNDHAFCPLRQNDWPDGIKRWM